MPTLVEVSGANYPSNVPPMEGISLAPTFQSTAALPGRAICFQHEGAQAIRKGQWKLVKGKRFPTPAKWELYDIKADPCELNDLATQKPDLVTSLSTEWTAWATRTNTPTETAAKKPKKKKAANTKEG